MMLHFLRCRRAGFTLIEIMIVIAIIAILAGIAIPNIVEARREAQMESCKGNIKYMANALEMYSVRHTHPYDRGIDSMATAMHSTGDGTWSSGGSAPVIGYCYFLWQLEEVADVKPCVCPCCDPSWGADASYYIYYSFVEDAVGWIGAGWNITCIAGHIMGCGHEFQPFYPALNGTTEYCRDCGGVCRTILSGS